MLSTIASHSTRRLDVYIVQTNNNNNTIHWYCCRNDTIGTWQYCCLCRRCCCLRVVVVAGCGCCFLLFICNLSDLCRNDLKKHHVASSVDEANENEKIQIGIPTPWSPTTNNERQGLGKGQLPYSVDHESTKLGEQRWSRACFCMYPILTEDALNGWSSVHFLELAACDVGARWCSP